MFKGLDPDLARKYDGPDFKKVNRCQINTTSCKQIRFCCMAIVFSNSLEPNQSQINAGPMSIK